MTSTPYKGLCDKGPYHGKWLAQPVPSFVVYEAPRCSAAAWPPDPEDTFIVRTGIYRFEFGVWVWMGWSGEDCP